MWTKGTGIVPEIVDRALSAHPTPSNGSIKANFSGKICHSSPNGFHERSFPFSSEMVLLEKRPIFATNEPILVEKEATGASEDTKERILVSSACMEM